MLNNFKAFANWLNLCYKTIIINAGYLDNLQNKIKIVLTQRLHFQIKKADGIRNRLS